MNQVCLIGNLTDTPEVKQGNDRAYANFTVAVQRISKDANGNYKADFIKCVAFGHTAEFIGRHFSKGQKIGIAGHLNVSSVEYDGVNRTVVKVVADNVDFAGQKPQAVPQPVGGTYSELIPNAEPSDEFAEYTPLNDDELPF